MSNAPENLYRGEAGRAYQAQKRSIPAAALPWVTRLRAEKFQPFVQPTDIVLELGAGLGWNLAQLQCARRLASDLENYLSPDLRSSGIEFVSDSKTLPYESIDVVICHHVLEHVPAPLEMLSEISRLLRPEGGQLILHVPFEKERRYRFFNPTEPNHHLYSWNVQTLGNLLTVSRFHIRELSLAQFGYDRAAASFATRFHVGEKGFRFLRRLAHLYKPALEIRAVAVKIPGGEPLKLC